ncbi:MAG: Uma2 family endonuclease [Verrucomicrobia bacterium]|nr:Uma2 family endonuclease [Verrucomicrobiota bacterium]
MSSHYEETFEGETFLRLPPGQRHEVICARLHNAVRRALAPTAPAQLAPTRTIVQVSAGTFTRPDLALVIAANAKPFLIAEIVEAGDHHSDTVIKKQFYEDARVPRLWMVDPRYNNVEVYHAGPHGLALRHILAGEEFLTEASLPSLKLAVKELFAE